jgi:hypothetical protein
MADIQTVQDQLSQAGVARHETFVPRYGWVKKGYDASIEDGAVFSAPDSIERLGVGKNMVRSIRFWCLAFHLLDFKDGEARRGQKGSLCPTDLGKRLIADDGWDPYLEDPASLWLLHWELFAPPLKAASWPLVYNHLFLPTFDLQQLGHSLVDAASQYERLSSLAAGSFEKDASCLIRMYTPFSGETSEIESPFSLIGLINHGEEPNTFRFNVGPKETLPSHIFAAACFSYAYHTQPQQRTLSFHKIVYGFNSPGVAFKISETEAGRYLDDVATKERGVHFIDSLGDRQLQFDRSPDDLYLELLNNYYGSKTRSESQK